MTECCIQDCPSRQFLDIIKSQMTFHQIPTTESNIRQKCKSYVMQYNQTNEEETDFNNAFLCTEHFSAFTPPDSLSEFLINKGFDSVTDNFVNDCDSYFDIQSCAILGCDGCTDLFDFPPVQRPNVLDTEKKIRKHCIDRARREAWKDAINQPDLSDEACNSLFVCGKHFVEGYPSGRFNTENVDWVPTLHLPPSKIPPRLAFTLLRMDLRVVDPKQQDCVVVGCDMTGRSALFQIPSYLRILPTNNDMEHKIQVYFRERRKAWETALNRPDLTEAKLNEALICSKHFISGKPAPLLDVENVDWLPNKNLYIKTNRQPKTPSKFKDFETVDHFTKKNLSTEKHAVEAELSRNYLRQKTIISTIPKRPKKVLNDTLPPEQKDLFVNGQFDTNAIGRTVHIDHVVDGMKQTFVIKLITEQENENSNTENNETECDKLIAIKTPLKLKTINHQFNYKDYLIRKLSPRSTYKVKKQSFKKLVLSYRTLQKNAMKIKKINQNKKDTI